MEIQEVHPGDKVTLTTKTNVWSGHILESYDREITLLKLESGYNIGIRNSEIHKAQVLEQTVHKQPKKEAPKHAKANKNIALIVTGGTISSRLDPKSGAVTWTTVEDILDIAPEIQDIANITQIVSPFMKGSGDMSLKHWKEIAETAYTLLCDDTIDGLIITHGTDTIHYGAAALAFFIQDLNKPVAFTYAQRSIDRASTDAHLNLICAAKYATSDIAEVAVIGHKDLNDKECLALPATKCRKMHTSRRDAFKVINDIPIATITKDTCSINRAFRARSNTKPKLDAKYSDKVALIKVYPGQNPDILEYYYNQGYRGIILEASGLGHLPGKASIHNWHTTIKKLIKEGMIIAAAPTTLYGRLNPSVYSYGRELEKTGIIFLHDMLPDTAFIKLSWIMGHKSWVYNNHSAQEKLTTNMVGEITHTTRIDEIL